MKEAGRIEIGLSSLYGSLYAYDFFFEFPEFGVPILDFIVSSIKGTFIIYEIRYFLANFDLNSITKWTRKGGWGFSKG
jgi:hypothetical protein